MIAVRQWPTFIVLGAEIEWLNNYSDIKYLFYTSSNQLITVALCFTIAFKLSKVGLAGSDVQPTSL
jgi:predicted permease